jgi:hypothetical protein
LLKGEYELDALDEWYAIVVQELSIAVERLKFIVHSIILKYTKWQSG